MINIFSFNKSPGGHENVKQFSYTFEVTKLSPAMMYIIFLQAPGQSNQNYFYLYLLIFFLIIIYLFSYRSVIVDQWNCLYVEMEHDPEEFYGSITETLRERQMPDFKASHRTFHEGGILSHQRLYLEVSRGNLKYHICAAQWGVDYFFSWWLVQNKSAIEKFLPYVPIFGRFIVIALERQTYYEMDSAAMFRASVEGVVAEKIKELTDAKEVRRLPDVFRHPDLRTPPQ